MVGIENGDIAACKKSLVLPAALDVRTLAADLLKNQETVDLMPGDITPRAKHVGPTGAIVANRQRFCASQREFTVEATIEIAEVRRRSDRRQGFVPAIDAIGRRHIAQREMKRRNWIASHRERTFTDSKHLASIRDRADAPWEI